MMSHIHTFFLYQRERQRLLISQNPSNKIIMTRMSDKIEQLMLSKVGYDMSADSAQRKHQQLAE